MRTWLTHTETVFRDRILGFTAVDARIWGRLSADLGRDGADLMIAATALNRDTMVVTRNSTHFAPTGAATVNPS